MHQVWGRWCDGALCELGMDIEPRRVDASSRSGRARAACGLRIEGQSGSGRGSTRRRRRAGGARTTGGGGTAAGTGAAVRTVQALAAPMRREPGRTAGWAAETPAAQHRRAATAVRPTSASPPTRSDGKHLDRDRTGAGTVRGAPKGCRPTSPTRTAWAVSSVANSRSSNKTTSSTAGSTRPSPKTMSTSSSRSSVRSRCSTAAAVR